MENAFYLSKHKAPSHDVFFWCKNNIYSWDSEWDSIQLTMMQDIKVNRISDMQYQISKKINIKRKTKKITFSLVSDLDVEEFMLKVSYQQFLSFLNFMNMFWLKRNSNEMYIKIYKETFLFAHSIKELKVNFLNIFHTAVCTFY